MQEERLAKYLLRGLCSIRSQDKQRYLEKALVELWGNESTEMAKKALKWRGGVGECKEPVRCSSEPTGHRPLTKRRREANAKSTLVLQMDNSRRD
jgi:hypothetical protein